MSPFSRTKYRHGRLTVPARRRDSPSWKSWSPWPSPSSSWHPSLRCWREVFEQRTRSSRDPICRRRLVTLWIRVSRDLLVAGSGLPPEFPTFTPPNVNPDLDASGGGPEAIEIVGYFDSSAAGVEPWPIVSFDGEKVRAEKLPPHIGPGKISSWCTTTSPTNGMWLFGLVSTIAEVSTPVGPLRELTIQDGTWGHGREYHASRVHRPIQSPLASDGVHHTGHSRFLQNSTGRVGAGGKPGALASGQLGRVDAGGFRGRSSVSIFHGREGCGHE